MQTEKQRLQQPTPYERKVTMDLNNNYPFENNNSANPISDSSTANQATDQSGNTASEPTNEQSNPTAETAQEEQTGHTQIVQPTVYSQSGAQNTQNASASPRPPYAAQTQNGYQANSGQPINHYPYTSANPNRQWQYNTPPKKEKKEHPFAKRLGKAAATAAVFGVVAGVLFQGVDFAADRLLGDSSSNVSSVITTSSSGTQTTTYDVSQIVENVMPSMVAIDIIVTQTVQTPFYFFGYGYGDTYEQQETGSGTGIIISQNDDYLYIVTNNHVIEDATSITVTFCDNTTASAVVRGNDEDSDLAVVQVALSDIDSETLNTIKVAVMGDSDTIQLGEPAIAIGNALGYGQSVTVGYISALEREVQLTDKTMTLIQTDAAINPGNSGGALINSNGEVIGINSVKYASTDVEGIGYAIPINTAIPIINAMVNGTALPESEKAYLGITGTDVTEQMQIRYGLPTGVYVTDVTTGSPAAEGGIQPYDIITSFDGQEITTMEQLTTAIGNKKAGDTVTIVVKRHTDSTFQDQTLTVTLDSVSNAPDEDDEESYGYQYDSSNGFSY